ncbi:MAG: hypothetical protein AAF698_02600 [Pseudomonadota bacterium]
MKKTRYPVAIAVLAALTLPAFAAQASPFVPFILKRKAVGTAVVAGSIVASERRARFSRGAPYDVGPSAYERGFRDGARFNDRRALDPVEEAYLRGLRDGRARGD